MDNRAFHDPFGVLGLPSTASKDDVKQAFRRLALKVHPDVDPSPEAAARFREVKRAADVLLKGQYHHAAAAGPGPSSAYGAWQSYASSAAAHDGWRPLRSRHTALWFCAASLVGGFGILWFALISHDWMDGYRWLTPETVDQRMKHPSPRRQHLVQLLHENHRAAAAGQQGADHGAGAS